MPSGVLTFILTCLAAISHEPSGCFVNIDFGSNIPSLFGLSILIYHCLPPSLVGYISFIPNLSTVVGGVVVAEIRVEFWLLSSFIRLWTTVGANVPRIAINMNAMKCTDLQYNCTKQQSRRII
jgi:hypothetical protein